MLSRHHIFSVLVVNRINWKLATITAAVTGKSFLDRKISIGYATTIVIATKITKRISTSSRRVCYRAGTKVHWLRSPPPRLRSVGASMISTGCDHTTKTWVCLGPAPKFPLAAGSPPPRPGSRANHKVSTSCGITTTKTQVCSGANQSFHQLQDHYHQDLGLLQGQRPHGHRLPSWITSSAGSIIPSPMLLGSIIPSSILLHKGPSFHSSWRTYHYPD